MPTAPVCVRCRGPLAPYAGTGRPSRYCRPACRKAAYRARVRRKATPRSEWWTPPALVARVSAEHRLGLDAAACEVSTLVPDNWLGPRHPDRDRRDALAVPCWSTITPPGTTVWVNPPYTPVPVLRGFLEKAVQACAGGTPVLALIPASTGANWWHDYVIEPGAQVEFLRGRLSYGGPHSGGGPAPWPSALVHYPA